MPGAVPCVTAPNTSRSSVPGVDTAAASVRSPPTVSAVDAADTGAETRSARASVTARAPVVVKPPSTSMLLPAATKDADAALPVSVPAVTAPAGWVMAPVAESASVPGTVTAPARSRSPVTARVASPARNGPVTDKDCPSVSVKAPVAVTPPRVPTRLPAVPSAMDAAPPASVPAVIVPPVWLTAWPGASRVSVPAAVIVPAVCDRVPPLAPSVTLPPDKSPVDRNAPAEPMDSVPDGLPADTVLATIRDSALCTPSDPAAASPSSPPAMPSLTPIVRIALAGALSARLPVLPVRFAAASPSVPPPSWPPGLIPSVTVPVVRSCSVVACPVRSTASLALAMLTGPVLSAAPRPSRIAVMRESRRCDTESDAGSAAVAPISSMRRDASNGAKVTAPPDAMIAVLLDGSPTRPTLFATKVNDPVAAVSVPALLPKSRRGELVTRVKSPACCEKYPMPATALLRLFSTVSPVEDPSSSAVEIEEDAVWVSPRVFSVTAPVTEDTAPVTTRARLLETVSAR